MHWSTFCRWFNENKSSLPASVRDAIKAEGVGRYKARIQSGYGAEPLDFTDLIQRGERAIAGF